MLHIGFGNSTGVGGAGLADIASYILLAVMLAVVIGLSLWAYAKTISVPIRVIAMITDFALMLPLKAIGPYFMWIAALFGILVVGRMLVDALKGRWEV